jgi:hypothetical protein
VASGEPLVSIVPPFLDPVEADPTVLDERDVSVTDPRSTRTPRPTRTPSRERDDDNDEESTVDPVVQREPTATRTPSPTRTLRPTDEPAPTRTLRPTDEPAPTRTPSPTRTPRPEPTDTPRPTATPRLGPPEITGTDPGSAICESDLTIRGKNFGGDRDQVDGQVFITGIEAEDYLEWSSSRIRVVVPSSVRAGNDASLEVSVAGRTARHSLRVSC